MATGSASFSLRNGKGVQSSNDVDMRFWPAPGHVHSLVKSKFPALCQRSSNPLLIDEQSRQCSSALSRMTHIGLQDCPQTADHCIDLPASPQYILTLPYAGCWKLVCKLYTLHSTECGNNLFNFNEREYTISLLIVVSGSCCQQLEKSRIDPRCAAHRNQETDLPEC